MRLACSYVLVSGPHLVALCPHSSRLRVSDSLSVFPSACRFALLLLSPWSCESRCRPKLEKDPCPFMAESDINSQEHRFYVVESKPETDVAFQVFQVYIASSGFDFSYVSKDGHV